MCCSAGCRVGICHDHSTKFSTVLQVTLLAGLQRRSSRSGAPCVQGIVGSMPWNAMVFITLWLQLLGFSDFAASLLMALFALGSALGGLLGGAIGAPPYYTHVWTCPSLRHYSP